MALERDPGLFQSAGAPAQSTALREVWSGQDRRGPGPAPHAIR